MNREVDAIRRDLSSSEMREIMDPVMQVMHLHFILGYRPKCIIDAGIVSERCFFRGKSAVKLSRVPGKKGRPCLLCPENDEKLVNQIAKENQNGNFPRANVVLNMV
jgi:hypothetical protein